MARFQKVVFSPYFLWILVGIFGFRDLILTALERHRPDTLTFLAGGLQMRTDPHNLYSRAAEILVRTHVTPLPGGIEGFLSPVPVAFIFYPLSYMANSWGVYFWVGLDIFFILLALFILEKLIRPEGVLQPAFWAVAFFFPPLFAELDAGQMGGLMLLLAVGAMSWSTRNPRISGFLIAGATAIKLFPASLLLGVAPQRRWKTFQGWCVAALALFGSGYLVVGSNQTWIYLSEVLPIASNPSNPDCAIVSIRSLLLRFVGGQSWAMPGSNGVIWHQAPWAFPELVVPLYIILVVTGLLGAFWAIKRASYAPAYSLSVALGWITTFSGHAFPYHWLLLLPLILVSIVNLARSKQKLALLGMMFGLFLFAKPPCDALIPNLWTMGGLICYWLSVTQVRKS